LYFEDLLEMFELKKQVANFYQKHGKLSDAESETLVVIGLARESLRDGKVSKAECKQIEKMVQQFAGSVK
jgi:hypothetical protein